MKKKVLAMMLATVMACGALAGCGGSAAAAPAAAETAEDAGDVEEADADVEEADADVEEAADDAAADVTYVDGFYANDGEGNDFMIAFYEGAAGDVAYVNDGTNEALAEYVVEDATLDDGTAYLLVTVGNTVLGYIEDGDDIYIIDADGNLYAAGRLSEEEADAIYTAVTQ